MSALTRPRGPLPARVYWIRRMLLIGTALALTVGLGMTLTRLSDGSSGPGGAAVQAAAQSSAAPTAADSQASEKKKKSTKKKRKKKPAETLPQPSGPCLASDVDATPVVKDAVAGGPVSVRFRIVTRLSLACTWQASSESLTMKITSGEDLIWSSQQCPRAIPTKDLVLRRSKASWLTMKWSAKRSDEDCGRATEWALPGWYHISVAPLGGEPEDVQFKLSLPEAEVITASPSPEQKQEGKKDSSKNGGKNASPGVKPSASPSGAVEPNG